MVRTPISIVDWRSELFAQARRARPLGRCRTSRRVSAKIRLDSLMTRRDSAAVVRLARHYVDPRLVALYDIENASRDDTDFYLSLADELEAHSVVDLGCGTGVLARELAATGGRWLGLIQHPRCWPLLARDPAPTECNGSTVMCTS